MSNLYEINDQLLNLTDSETGEAIEGATLVERNNIQVK